MIGEPERVVRAEHEHGLAVEDDPRALRPWRPGACAGAPPAPPTRRAGLEDRSQSLPYGAAGATDRKLGGHADGPGRTACERATGSSTCSTARLPRRGEARARPRDVGPTCRSRRHVDVAIIYVNDNYGDWNSSAGKLLARALEQPSSGGAPARRRGVRHQGAPPLLRAHLWTPVDGRGEDGSCSSARCPSSGLARSSRVRASASPFRPLGGVTAGWTAGVRMMGDMGAMRHCELRDVDLQPPGASCRRPISFVGGAGTRAGELVVVLHGAPAAPTCCLQRRGITSYVTSTRRAPVATRRDQDRSSHPVADGAHGLIPGLVSRMPTRLRGLTGRGPRQRVAPPPRSSCRSARRPHVRRTRTCGPARTSQRTTVRATGTRRPDEGSLRAAGRRADVVRRPWRDGLVAAPAPHGPAVLKVRWHTIPSARPAARCRTPPPLEEIYRLALIVPSGDLEQFRSCLERAPRRRALRHPSRTWRSTTWCRCAHTR